METVKHTVLSLTHAPRIVRPGPIAVEFIVLAGPEGHREIARHWDANLNATVPCSCQGMCETRRLDHFISGLTWFAPQTWEQTVLHFTDLGWSILHNLLQVKNLSLKGAWGTWQRRSANKNGPVCIKLLGNPNVQHQPVDIGYVLQRRLGLTTDFFGGDNHLGAVEELAPAPTDDTPLSLADVRGLTGKAGSSKPRSAKPRVSKGCGPCHKRRAKDSP